MTRHARTAALLAAILLFTGTVSLAYVVYPDWQSGEPWRLGWGWRALQYGPCVLVAAGGWTDRRRAMRAAPPGRRERPG